MRIYVSTIVLLLMSGGLALTQETNPKDESIIKEPEAESVTTQHSVLIDGRPIRYTATAGLAVMRNGEDEATGLFGYTSYIKDGVDDPSNRPIMFAYNGGPGSASIWLHMGVLGPRRIPGVDTEVTGPAPFSAINNEFSNTLINNELIH